MSFPRAAKFILTDCFLSTGLENPTILAVNQQLNRAIEMGKETVTPPVRINPLLSAILCCYANMNMRIRIVRVSGLLNIQLSNPVPNCSPGRFY